MRSQAQIEASRLNGAKSKGPVTEEGKAISARNSYKTGMYASFSCLMPKDDQELFNELRDVVYDTYQPEGWEEIEIVENIVRDKWRVRRAVCAEAELQNMDEVKKSLLPLESFSPEFQAAVKNVQPCPLGSHNYRYSAALSRVHRHIAQLDKSIISLVKQLKELRAEKRKEEQENQKLQNEPKTENKDAAVELGAILKSGGSMAKIVKLLSQNLDEDNTPKRTQAPSIHPVADPALIHTPSKNWPNQ